jgi:hypothetical protein
LIVAVGIVWDIGLILAVEVWLGKSNVCLFYLDFYEMGHFVLFLGIGV